MGSRINDSHDSLYIDSSNGRETISGTSRIHQRRNQYSMRGANSPSSLVLVESSSDDSQDSQPRSRSHKPLMVSESQSSLGGLDVGRSSHVALRQPPRSMMYEWRPRLILAWTMHLASCVLILLYGSSANQGGRKYIPIDVSTIDEECDKAFVDVFSSSLDETAALICCPREGIAGLTSSSNTHICQSPPSYLLFARRLARFPDAWLLPLFPLFVRGVWQIYCNATGKTSMLRLNSVYARRRLYLYLGLIQIRGWILYLAFDEMEHFFVQSAGTQCWYEPFLHSHYNHCQGRMTDFSDHVVLYFAQILPIALTEILHAFTIPFWLSDTRAHRRSGEGRSTMFVPGLLVFWLINLYVVTFMGAYKTAAYFHTGSEVFIGFLISLLVQVPLLLLQCTSVFGGWKVYFFGPSCP